MSSYRSVFLSKLENSCFSLFDEPYCGGQGLSKEGLEPAGRALEPAGKASEPAGRAS